MPAAVYGNKRRVAANLVPGAAILRDPDASTGTPAVITIQGLFPAR
jgi:hypothetical protein